jgi:ankyrin repeat protein
MTMNNPEILEVNAAAQAGDLGKVMELINNDIELLNCRDMEFDRPLHYAVKEGHFEMVQWLVEKGADMNAPNMRNRTPLHWACYMPHVEIALYMARKGASKFLMSNSSPNSAAPPVAACCASHDSYSTISDFCTAKISKRK